MKLMEAPCTHGLWREEVDHFECKVCEAIVMKPKSYVPHYMRKEEEE